MNTAAAFRKINVLTNGIAILLCATIHADTPSYYRPGLIQAKFSGTATMADAYPLDVLNHPTAERVRGAVMADIQANNGTAATTFYYNEITGNSWNWDGAHTAFGYVGQMYVKANVTYTFGKIFDDSARIVIDGQTVIEHGSWNEFQPGTYTATADGWVDIDIRIHDGDGGKGPTGNGEWGADLGLAYNTNNHAAQGPKSAWSRLIDPGDGSLFRAPMFAATTTEPVFGVAPEIAWVAPDFVMSVALTHGEADIYALVGTSDAYTVTNLIAAGVTAGNTATGPLSGLAPDTMYTVAAFATNSVDETALLASDVPFYSGEIWLELGQNGAEENAVPGKVVVRRADTDAATRMPLVVNYTVTDITAVVGVNYEAPSGTVTIPQGADSAEIVITPLVDIDNRADVALSVALAPGFYRADESDVTVAILDWKPSAERNTWIAETDGYASDAANWSLGVPTATDHIALGLFSSANMIWDAGSNSLPATVASWTQDEYYAGTVTFPVTYPEHDTAFTNFTVTGDATLVNGTWTHPANGNTQAHRLCVTVGGDFTLGADAKIELRYKGYAARNFPSGGAIGIHGGSRDNFEHVYGNPYKPYDLGAGGTGLPGGGALWLDITGDAVIDGLVRANGYDVVDPWWNIGSGAGGSIYVKAHTVAGSGTVTASTAPVDHQGTPGSGGRIAFDITSDAELGIPLGNISAAGCIGAEGAWRAASVSTGAGTIVIKNAAQQHGTLYLNNVVRDSTFGHRFPSKFGTTPVKPGETWTFDAVVTAGHGILSVPENATLVLPDGFGSVSGTSYNSGILYLGGDIDFADCETPYVFRSPWVFHPNAPYTVNGNVAVVEGGAVGLLQLDNQSVTEPTKCDLAVNGDMTVDATSWIYARNAGFDFSFGDMGNDYVAHGGQQGTATDIAYGSILNPVLPGVNGAQGNSEHRAPGGGLVLLRVFGNLHLDGIAESSGDYTENADWAPRGGAGGSINITTDTLTGSGFITAKGAPGSYQYWADGGFRGSSGGGRIAVRLTAPGATFDDFGIGRITANGRTGWNMEFIDRSSSAGTVYLQDASQAEGTGTIIVRNDNNPLNTASATVIPATRYGGLDDDLSLATLRIQDCARVKLSTSFKMREIVLQENTALDLNGKRLVVDECLIAGAKLRPKGAFFASELVELGFTGVIDTSENADGILEITDPSARIIIR